MQLGLLGLDPCSRAEPMQLGNTSDPAGECTEELSRKEVLGSD